MCDILKYKIPEDAYYGGYFYPRDTPEAFARKGFYWIFRKEYKKRVEALCPACIDSTEGDDLHLSSCLHSFHVIVDENLILDVMKVVNGDRIENVAHELCDIYGAGGTKEHLCYYDFDGFLKNMSEREFSRAVNYRFIPMYNSLSSDL